MLGKCRANVQQPSSNPRPPELGTTSRRAPWPRRMTRPRKFLAAAAVLLAIFAAFGLTEASGVTKITATIIRIVRGDGTLVVQVDDPNVQVVIDGEELVITGAGPKEIR